MRILLTRLQQGMCHLFRIIFGGDSIDCFLFLGPGCFGFRHRDHQTSSEISRRGKRPDYDDLLHD